MGSDPTKVLYLSYDGLTDPLGQSQILPYLLRLARRGFSIRIISFEKKSKYLNLGKEIHATCESFNIVWYPLVYHKYPPIFSTLYDLWALYKKAKNIYKEYDFKIVHCRSYITSLIGLQLKQKLGVKFLFDMRGFWVDERVEGGLWNLKNPVYRLMYNFFKRKEKLFLNESDHIVSLTKNAKQEIIRQHVKTPITVIPTCVDTEFFNPERINPTSKEALRVQLGIDQNDLVLLYLGSWGTWYMTKEMLGFFVNLKGKYANAKFLIVTPDKIDLKDFEFAKDVIITSAKRSEVPLYSSLATFSILLIKPSFSKKASSATKMGELLAMNIPVITNPGWGDVEEIVNATGSFFAHEFISQNIDRNFRPQTRLFCNDTLSLEMGVKHYAGIYNQLAEF